MSAIHYLVAVGAVPSFLIDCRDCKTSGTATPDTSVAADTTESHDVGPGEVPVSRRHWRMAFDDEFKGPTGKPTDSYCYDTLPPQCHIWPGGTFDCDFVNDPGSSPIPPLKENLVAAIKLFEPNHDFGSMSLADVKATYSQILSERLADLDKCTWTLYMMVNWMATDYAGHWSARFDPSQVQVDASGKGLLKLFATHAPVDASCIFGGTLGGPNCNLKSFGPGELDPATHYWVDPDPRWPGIYYAPTNGGCPHGGTFSGVNCTLYSFPDNLLEAHDVSYWVDADPRWPGVYYANETYACRDNIDYAPTFGFRNLTCPILDGAVMSYPQQATTELRDRGEAQHFGRFEAKARIPKGQGAFPATWLMPLEGGWPYDGGEIDVMEARDAADEVYQTFHSGRCYDGNAHEIDATDSADCAAKGGTTTHMSKGYTVRERAAGEFWTRFHLFAVEWTDEGGGRLDYYINNVKIGSVTVGMNATLDAGAPASLSPFSGENFPTSPFYWILNHSTWVAPDKRAAFAQQTFEIDYVRNYVECLVPADYCPDGGDFVEDVGCEKGDGTTYASPCTPSKRECVNGGEAEGDKCRVWSFQLGEVVANVSYWVDSDPRWPGVYYAKINGGCPYGGGGTVNCGVVSLPGDVLETGITYSVDASTSPPGIYYAPDFRH